ncbi:MAG: ABC transporter substrate-binding protein [Clostridiales bacterium]|nr:ABC transporter substrate-binding protein [Clostridiales bacterium]
MRRILTVLVAVLVGCAALLPVHASENDASLLTVGHTTMLSGNFFSDIWGNNSADNDVRNLIHDYPIVAWTVGGEYLVNDTVVEDLTWSTDEAGNKTYVVTLHRDLQYCDGTAITAKDYVFTLLFFSSPCLAELGAAVTSKDYILGHQDYVNNPGTPFSGIRLLGEHVFSVTIDADFMPYYYDINYLNVFPYPYKVLLPGSDVVDNGRGAYILGGISAEVLKETLMDPEHGYLRHPRVTSGPYRLVSYDDALHIAEFELNPLYKGNYEKQKPSISRIVFRVIKNENIAAELASGAVGLVNKITQGEVIDAVRELSGESSISMVDYPRTGSAFLAFSCEREMVSSAAMRKAVAMCLDRDALIDDLLGEYGVPVYGYYGAGQWMAKEKGDALKALNRYRFNLSNAARLFVDEGWTLNEQGQAYDAASDTLRYRRQGDKLQPLVFRMALIEHNASAIAVKNMLERNLKRVGAILDWEEMRFDQLLKKHYRQEERQYDLCFLGSNFTYIFDPYYTYHTGDKYQGVMNTSGLRDEKLLQLARELREVPPGDRKAYLEKWFAFQDHWVEALPLVPLYSNIYSDAFTSRLKNYNPDKHWSWAIAILYSTLDP